MVLSFGRLMGCKCATQQSWKLCLLRYTSDFENMPLQTILVVPFPPTRHQSFLTGNEVLHLIDAFLSPLFHT